MKIWFCYYLVWNFGNKTESSLFFVSSSFLCFSVAFWSTFYLLTVSERAGGVHSLTVGVYNCCFDLKTSFTFLNIFSSRKIYSFIFWRLVCILWNSIKDTVEYDVHTFYSCFHCSLPTVISFSRRVMHTINTEHVCVIRTVLGI